MSMNNKLGIGILGCGAVAHRWYLSGLCKPSNIYEVRALADPRPDIAEIAQSNGVRTIYKDLEPLLSDESIDIVVILTRHHDHEVQVRAALNAGKHVYCEKPMAENAAAAASLRDLASSKGLVLASAPQVMLSARNLRVKQLMESGAIGAFTYGRISVSNLGPAHRPEVDYDPEWFYQDGGSLESLGIYGVAAMVWMFGAPLRVTCMQGIAFPHRTVKYGPVAGKEFEVTAPDSTAAIFDYGDSRFITFDGSYSVTNAPKREFELHGTQGSLYAGGFGGPQSVELQPIYGESRYEGVEAQDDWTLAWGVVDMIEAVYTGSKPTCDVDLAIDVLHTLDAMKRAATESLVVKVESSR